MTIARFASHVHSEWSDDASWSLQALRAAFQRRGYAGAMMCEHDRGFTPDLWGEYQEECERLSDDRFVLVPGIEYGDGDNVVHLPVWGSLPFLGEERESTELLEEVSEAGGLAVFAHPWRRDAWERFDPSWAEHLVGLEVWNRKYDGVAPDRSASRLAIQNGIREFVALDFHTSRQFFPLATRFELDGELSMAGVLDALRTGRWRPEFLGRSALAFTGGTAGTFLRMLESARRIARTGLSGVRSRGRA